MNNEPKNNVEWEEHLKEIRVLTHQIRRSNSLKQKFLSALIYGFGTIIGATILITALISILTLLASHGILTDFNTWLVDTIKR